MTDEGLEAEIRLRADHPNPFALAGQKVLANDVRTLLRLLDAERAKVARLEATIEAKDQAETDRILALSDDNVIAEHVAAYNDASLAVDATRRAKIAVLNAVIDSYKRQVARLTAPPDASDEALAERCVYDNAGIFHPHQLEAIDPIARAIAEAKRATHTAGRVEMREEAVQLCQKRAADHEGLYVLEGFPEDLKYRDAVHRVALRIQKLPDEKP